MIWPFTKKATAYRTNARPEDEPASAGNTDAVEVRVGVAGGRLFRRVQPQHKCEPPRIDDHQIRVEQPTPDGLRARIVAIDVQDNDIWQCACEQRWRVAGNTYVLCGAALDEDADQQVEE